VVCSARTPRPGRYATLHLEDANRGRTAGEETPVPTPVRRAALRSYLGSAHGFADAVQDTAVPFVLPQSVCVHGAERRSDQAADRGALRGAERGLLRLVEAQLGTAAIWRQRARTKLRIIMKILSVVCVGGDRAIGGPSSLNPSS
jgi:hypothetical protein